MLLGWLWAGYQSAIYGLAIDWLLAGYQMSIGRLSVGNWMAISYLLADSLLVISQNQYISRHVIYHYVPKWHMAAINTGHYCVHKIFWLSAGYVPNSIHFKTVLYYYEPNVHMVAINTLGCHVFARFFLAISWLLAGYVPNSIHFKTVIYYNVPKWHMAEITTLDCSVFTRIFGYRLAIGWLCDKINTLQTKS